MGIAVIPAPSAGGKTMYRTTLTSGTSWTVPTGVTYINVTLTGGGGGGGGGGWTTATAGGTGGTTTFTGATSAAGGGGGPGQNNSTGPTSVNQGRDAAANSGQYGTGSTKSTNTSQVSINGSPGATISSTLNTTPGASISYSIGAGGSAGSGPNSGDGYQGGNGGSGKIDIEYWL